MQAIFPLWGYSSQKLAHKFLNLKFKAIITCIDTTKIPKNLIRHKYNKIFLKKIPDSVDPCGENGEFHSFVYSGPIFKEKLNIHGGEITLRYKRFLFYDLKIS